MTGIVGPSIPAKRPRKNNGSLITGRWVSSWVGRGGSPIEGERPHFSGWWLVTYWKLSRYYLTWHSSIFAVPCMLQVMIYSLACLMCITLVYLQDRAIARINDGINIGVTISWTLTSTSSQLTNIFQRGWHHLPDMYQNYWRCQMVPGITTSAWENDAKYTILTLFCINMTLFNINDPMDHG